MKKNRRCKKNKKAATRTRTARPASMRVRTDAALPVERAGDPKEPMGSAGERFYTAEEIGAMYGITADEVTAIAEGIGIIGDPRYGKWVPSETPPRKSEERIPISTSVGPIARVSVEHMLRQVDDQLKELIVKSAKAGPDFTILVYDPMKPITGEFRSDKERELVAHAKGKPLAALLPTETVLTLLDHFERTPDLLTMPERLKAPRDGTRVPIVLMYGPVLGFHEAVLVRDDFAMHPDLDFTQLPGADGYTLSLTGAIKLLCSAEPEDLAPGWPTERVRLARAKAMGAIEAERMKPNPRSVNEVLVETFGGDRLRRAFETRDAEGFVDVIDSALRATN